MPPITESLPLALPLKIYAVCCVVLFLKMFAIALVQGSRIKTGAFVNPEDAKFFTGKEPVPQETPLVQRGANAFRNDLENIPIFLFLALTYILTDCWATDALYYFPLFTVARIAHTLCYLNAIQPWRTVSYTVAITVNLCLSGHILYQVFSR